MKQRIRVSTSQDGSRVLSTVRTLERSSQDRANLSVQMRLQKNRRQRTVLKALVWTSIAHLLAVLLLFYFIEPATKHFDEVIHVEMVNEVLEKRKVIKPRQVTTINPTAVQADTADTARVAVKVPIVLSAGGGELPPIETESDPLQDSALDIRTPETDSPVIGGAIVPGTGLGQKGYRRSSGTGRRSGTGSSIGDKIGSGAGGRDGDGLSLGENATKVLEGSRVGEDQLGAVLEVDAQSPPGHIRIIRLKHSLSDWWQDPSAIPSFAKWLEENTQLRVDMTYAGGSLPLTDDRLLDAPLVIMTGHDKDIAVGRKLNRDASPLATGFNRAERAQLRKYIIEREGMLFFDDCGFNGNFAAIVQNELQRSFPEYPLRNIDHTHELYTVYYQLPGPPRGGDVFWGNLNKGDSAGYFATESQFRFQKGMTINRRLAVVFNRKDYMCAMETAEVGSRALLQMRRSTDVHRFMTNLLIYQMRYGGNTDRSGFKR